MSITSRYIWRRKNALLIVFGVEIVWGNQSRDEWMVLGMWIWPTCTDFAGADDIITNLAKEREHGIKIIKHTPQSLIITYMSSTYKMDIYYISQFVVCTDGVIAQFCGMCFTVHVWPTKFESCSFLMHLINLRDIINILLTSFFQSIL